jgi:hypothetical protein
MMYGYVMSTRRHYKLTERLEKRPELYDEGTRERMRTLVEWEMAGKIRIWGLDYGDGEDVPSEAAQNIYPNSAGCWIVGAPLVLYQEHRHVFPSELTFAQIALALEAGVGNG